LIIYTHIEHIYDQKKNGRAVAIYIGEYLDGFKWQSTRKRTAARIGGRPSENQNFGLTPINTPKNDLTIITIATAVPCIPGRTIPADARGAIGENLGAEVTRAIAEHQRADVAGVRTTRDSYSAKRQNRQ
jgi:hypothetical protein